MNLGGGHRLGFYCIAVSHAKGSVSLPLCGDSPCCSSNERADTYAQSNLSPLLSRSQEQGKIARNQKLGCGVRTGRSRFWIFLMAWPDDCRLYTLLDVISPPWV